MAGITNIEQSKVLSDILPAKSADMCWKSEMWCDICLGYKISSDTREPLFKEDILAWSLSAMLDAIPKDENVEVYLIKCSKYIAEYDKFLKTTRKKVISCSDNAIDAVFGLIVKLKEENLI